mgnify:CR=1 FL=1
MDYVELLKTKFENVSKEMQKAESIDSLKEIFESAMGYYAHELIPSFFSSGEGEGAKIKDLYKSIQENYYSKVVTEGTICDVDLNIAGSAYLEYLNGMCTFIGETCDTCIDGEKYAKESAAIDEKMNKAKSHDGEFIESIFGGVNNQATTETILEATRNIEYLIDFMDTIKQDSYQCGCMIDRIKQGMEKHRESIPLLMESARMMTESVNHYVYNTINTIFDSYNAIHNVLESKDNAPKTTKTKRVMF